MHRADCRATAWISGLLLLATSCASAPAVGGGPVPSGSPLARIQPGMSFEKVVELLGPPAAQEQHITLYAFSPLSFGPEVQWTSFHYPNVGRVIFQGPNPRGKDASVLGVEHDPTETGHAPD